MRKHLLFLSILSLLSLAAGPATVSSRLTPWQLLIQASDLPATDSPRCSAMSYRDYPPYSKAWWDMAWDSEQQNTAIFQLLHQSRLLAEKNGGHAGGSGLGTPISRWPPTESSVRAAVKPLDSMRNLANIVSDGAIFSHLNGNDAEAVDRLMDELNLGACIGQNNYLVSQLVSAGIDAQVVSTAEIIAPGLRLSLQPDHAQTRRETQKLLKILLDEQHVKTSLQASLDLEGPGMIRGFPAHATHPATQPASLSPAEMQRDQLLLDHAAELTNLPDMEATLARGDWPMGIQPIERLFVTEFRILSDRRMAAIDLAVQLYRADHGDNWPANLQALVPAYLPAIPRDPYRSDGALVGYKIFPHGWLDGRDRPVLFVDAGRDLHLAASPYLGWYSHGKTPLRQYRDLSSPTVVK